MGCSRCSHRLCNMATSHLLEFDSLPFAGRQVMPECQTEHQDCTRANLFESKGGKSLNCGQQKALYVSTGLSTYLEPGSSLLSHGETPHYHRRYGVSLLSSAWGQVGPPRYCRQAYSVSSTVMLSHNHRLKISVQAENQYLSLSTKTPSVL